MKTSLGRRSGQDLDIVELIIKNRGLTEEDEKLINHQNKYSEYEDIEVDTRQEIKNLQQEVEKWKCNNNRLKEDVIKIQREFRILSKNNYFSTARGISMKAVDLKENIFKLK